MGWYEFTDYITTSENERKRKKYSKLITKIEEKLVDLDEFIRSSINGMEGFNNVYTARDTLYGEAIEKFHEYGRNLEKSVEVEINQLEMAKSSLNSALDRANEMYNYYHKECIREDEEGANN